MNLFIVFHHGSRHQQMSCLPILCLALQEFLKLMWCHRLDHNQVVFTLNVMVLIVHLHMTDDVPCNQHMFPLLNMSLLNLLYHQPSSVVVNLMTTMLIPLRSHVGVVARRVIMLMILYALSMVKLVRLELSVSSRSLPVTLRALMVMSPCHML